VACGLADWRWTPAINNGKRGMRYGFIAFLLIILTARHLAQAQRGRYLSIN
jgi:hypothetical protein